MKRISMVAACLCLAVSMASCGKNSAIKDISKMEKISPDKLISVETVSDITGVTMTVSKDGIVSEGSTTSVTYVTSGDDEPGDPVTVQIEQFSESLSTNQIWTDYESNRVKRGDMEFVTGIGEDCYIAYPYINVYDRGCYVRISAGSGDSNSQKELLTKLAAHAAQEIENKIPAELASAAAQNVIK